MKTREFILTQEFSVKGNYPGMRTESFATEALKESIEQYVRPHSGPITRFPVGGAANYNGAFSTRRPATAPGCTPTAGTTGLACSF